GRHPLLKTRIAQRRSSDPSNGSSIGEGVVGSGGDIPPNGFHPDPAIAAAVCGAGGPGAARPAPRTDGARRSRVVDRELRPSGRAQARRGVGGGAEALHRTHDLVHGILRARDVVAERRRSATPGGAAPSTPVRLHPPDTAPGLFARGSPPRATASA